MRIWRLLFVGLLGSFVSVGALEAQELGLGGLKENLDLPLDAIGEVGEEEEAPEVVNFYGQNLEGDGFFYSIDASGSMRDSQELTKAKQEITRNVSEFSEKTEFGIVLFWSTITKYPTSGRPVAANAGSKQAAISWLAGQQGGTGSCMMEGLREALQMANMSAAKRKVVVYVGDGGGTCNGSNEQDYLRKMVSTITAQNYQRAQVNTIGVMMGTSRQMQESFMKQLSAANNGTYRRIY